MIVRTWHGCVPLKHAKGFAAHLNKTGVDHAKSVPGNLGAFVRREAQGDWEHFFLATYWEDLSAVKAFAGEDYHRGSFIAFFSCQRKAEVAPFPPFRNDITAVKATTKSGRYALLLEKCNPFLYSI